MLCKIKILGVYNFVVVGNQKFGGNLGHKVMHLHTKAKVLKIENAEILS